MAGDAYTCQSRHLLQLCLPPDDFMCKDQVVLSMPHQLGGNKGYQSPVAGKASSWQSNP